MCPYSASTTEMTECMLKKGMKCLVHVPTLQSMGKLEHDLLLGICHLTKVGVRTLCRFYFSCHWESTGMNLNLLQFKIETINDWYQQHHHFCKWEVKFFFYSPNQCHVISLLISRTILIACWKSSLIKELFCSKLVGLLKDIQCFSVV